MNTIGTTKLKILSKLTESYVSGNKKDMRDIITLIQSNKNFRDLYLFYEEVEKKYFESENDAKLYVDEVIPLLKEQFVATLPFIYKLNNDLGDAEQGKNELYENLDTLLSRRTIYNIDKKLNAKKRLIEHLTTKKEDVIKESVALVDNEKLFISVLTNNFNILYENTLSDEEKEELKSIMSLSSDDVEHRVSQLKEDVLSKVADLLVEATDDVKSKLYTVKNQVGDMATTKYNLYKLQELKNGLI